jgi:hypothetical protein
MHHHAPAEHGGRTLTRRSTGCPPHGQSAVLGHAPFGNIKSAITFDAS